MRGIRKFIILSAVLLSVVLPLTAQALVLFYSWPPYSCVSSMAGFNLSGQQNGYRLTGPVYVPLPGYSAALSDIRSNFSQPQEAEATLTLIPPSNILNRYALPRLAVVPPIWIDASFVFPVPLRKLTIHIANLVNRFDTKITCLLTGATQ